MKVISALTLFLLTNDVSSIKLTTSEDELGPPGEMEQTIAAPGMMGGGPTGPAPTPMYDLTPEENEGSGFYEGKTWQSDKQAVDESKEDYGAWKLSEDVPNGHPQISHSYELDKSPGNKSFQWIGYNVQKMSSPAQEGQWIRLGAWIKFEDTVPKPSKNLGFKITGKVHNEWLSDMEANKWKYVSATGPVTNGDKGFVLFIFDSMEDTETVKIAMPEMEIFDE